MSDNETLTDQSYAEHAKKTHKRRSSVFQVTRRLEDLSIENGVTEEEYGGQNDNPCEEELCDLRAYIDSLKNERKAWKETLTERKCRRRALQKEKFSIDKQGAKYDLGLLTESERSFVSARPPYQEIARKVNYLTDESMKVAILVLEAKNMKDRLTLMAEKKLVETTKKIIEKSREET